MKKILVVDLSGRGHAFAELLTGSDLGVKVLYAPGCSAIKNDRIQSFPHLRMDDHGSLVALARQEEVDFAMVTNTNALASGLVDRLEQEGIACTGPNMAAASLETSKVKTKILCDKYRIPVANFRTFEDYPSAANYIQSRSERLVVKADGLCAGAGTFICDSALEAINAARDLMENRIVGSAGGSIVIEDYLDGIELLFFGFVNGEQYKLLPMAVDYPKSDDGNMGVTCGGMGAFSPNPFDSPGLTRLFERQILVPLLSAIRSEGLDYSGIMYIGCMLVGDQLHLLEVNVRMGEPEAEVILPRIEGDFASCCDAVARGSFEGFDHLSISPRALCNVVATQGRTRQWQGERSKGWYKGWPYGRYGKGYPVQGVEEAEDAGCRVYIGQAAVDAKKGLVTDGGRCLHVVGMGIDLPDAVAQAYKGIHAIQFEGIQYRSDIGTLMPWVSPAGDLSSGTHTSIAILSNLRGEAERGEL
jgi:phosphoribosylamine---glycine ligase